MSKSIQFQLNGEHAAATVRPDMTVLEWLRGEAGLRGSKEGCAEGDCGACSVLIKRQGDEHYTPANSCIMLMGQLEGGNLITVEGITDSAAGGHPVQRVMAENGSSQCGFCTPGIVCALTGLGERVNDPSDNDIHEALAGNLCRCTGYRPIVEAAKDAIAQTRPVLPTDTKQAAAAIVGDEDCTFFLPTKLDELLELRKEHPDATLLAGGTDLSLAVAHARARWPKTISTRSVSDLRSIKVETDKVIFGAAVNWGDALPVMEKYWPSFATLVRRFGSVQIRTMGTMAGNIANASPIGDGAPALIALGAEVKIQSVGGSRSVPLDGFFKGYREPDLKADEIITAISVPKLSSGDQFRVYKISKRYDQDISTVCAAFNLTFEDGIVTDARMAFGGMAATPVRCGIAEAEVVGKRLDDSKTIAGVFEKLQGGFNPMSDMRGSEKYRAEVAANLFQRYAADIAGETVEVMAL